MYADGRPPSFGADFTTTFFLDGLAFIGIADVQEVRYGPTVVNADVEGTRRTAIDATVAAARRFAA